jgi:endonuclease YncB( thermonuclease family)
MRMAHAVATTKYLQTLARIGRTYEGARKTLVQSYWQIGRDIVELEQDGEVHAQYGAGLLKKISRDLSLKYGSGFSVKNIERMRLLYQANPKSSPVTKLPWSHQVALLQVDDQKKRKSLAGRAEREGLNKEEIYQLVREEGASGSIKAEFAAPLKRPKNLELATYKKSGEFIDCGFYVFYPLSKEDAADVTFRDVPSYTYAATVERVVDGDTLWVLIELGFGIVVREKLRLRGIDCPELGTSEGEQAKKFVSAILPAKSLIVIRSAKDDKYGRFVADVFYKKGEQRPEGIIASGNYLNQELLDHSLATRIS